MTPNRRDMAKFAGGAAAGLFLTPIPWKLLDDTAIWTQNWSSIPVPNKGPVEFKTAVCALCPAACPVKVRTAGGIPVSLAGAEHPLCPAGLAAHHLPWHPFRLTSALENGRPVATRKVIDAVAQAARTRPTAILDGRPGRPVSAVYLQFLAALPNGRYLTLPSHYTTLHLESVQTIVSFGAPLLESGPLLRHRRIRLLQIDPRHSRTASLSTRWYAIRPGSEAAVALAVAHILQPNRPTPFTPDRAASVCGLSTDLIAEIARAFQSDPAALAVAGPLPPEERAAVAALNPKAPALPAISSLDEIPDASLGLLILDAAALDADLPPHLLRRKLAPGAITVTLSAFRDGLAANSTFAVPTPAYLEGADAILPVPAHCIDSAAFIRALGPASPKPLPPPPPAKLDFARAFEGRFQPSNEFPLALLPFRMSETPAAQAQPPLLTKIYQESPLRPLDGAVFIHPETAASRRLSHNDPATLRTASGACSVRVTIDPCVRRDAIEAAVAPTAAQFSAAAPPGPPPILDLVTGRATAADLEKA